MNKNIKEILEKYTRIVDEEQGVGEYMKNKMIEELSNLLTQQREEAVKEYEEILKQVEENVRSDINGVGGNYDEELEELTKREADIRREALEKFVEWYNRQMEMPYGIDYTELETYLKENKDE